MIFYFTGTGNSLYIAKRIAAVTKDRILNIAREIFGDCSYQCAEGEKIVIVSPVYFYGLPTVVEEFIGKMRFDNSNNVYLALNYGSFPGQAMERAERRISDAGFVLKGRLVVMMPENYVMLFDPPNMAEARVIIDSARDIIDNFAQMLLIQDEIDLFERPTFAHRVVGAVARPLYVHGRGTGRFHTTGKCTGCGKCADMCPSKAIEMIDRIPTWTKSKCIRCNACLNRCPSNALEFGRGTSKRRRYINPDVEFDD